MSQLGDPLRKISRAFDELFAKELGIVISDSGLITLLLRGHIFSLSPIRNRRSSVAEQCLVVLLIL